MELKPFETDEEEQAARPKGSSRRIGRPRKTKGSEAEPSSRDKIVAAASQCFLDRGFDNTSLDQIAKGADLSIGTLYHNFENKDELLLTVVRDGLKKLHMPERPEDGAHVPLKGWIDFPAIYVSPESRALRRLAAEIHTAAARHPRAAVALQRLFHVTTSDVIDTLLWARERGDIDPSVDPVTAAGIYMTLCVGLIHIDTSFPQVIGDAAWAKSLSESVERLFGVKKS